MSANDSGIENSNDSNDFALTFPIGFKDFITSPSNLNELNTTSIQQPHMLNQLRQQSTTGKMKINKHSIKLATLPYFRARLNERKLRVAASISNVELLTKYLESGVNPNGCDELQRSALHLASSRGFTDIVAQLLKYGANPNQKDLLAFNHIPMSFKNSHPVLTELLLLEVKYFMDVTLFQYLNESNKHLVTLSIGNTPLHLAVCSASSINFNMTVRILLNHGASVRCTDKMGRNPLDLANSKLSLMRRRRCDYPESDKILRDMSILTAFLLWHYQREQQDDFEINSLEQRLQNLSTQEVENEADKLLAKVEKLKLQN